MKVPVKMHFYPKFTRLSILEFVGVTADRKKLCRVKCDCGKVRRVQLRFLRNGHTRSCGCIRVDAGFTTFKHGESKNPTPEYQSWKSMRQRVQNPRNSSYKYYGGRGITITRRWDSFTTFKADMGTRPPGTTLDRVNPDSGYRKTNCRWADVKTQRNNRRTNGKSI